MSEKKPRIRKDGTVKGGHDGTRPRPGAASLANLKPGWKPGQSGNPSGMPKSLVEITRLAREKSPAAIERLYSIMMNDAAPYRDQPWAAVALLDRGLGKPAMALFHGSGSVTSPMEFLEDGTPASPLIIDASKSAQDSAYKMALLAELKRVNALEKSGKTELADRLAEARAAKAQGEEIDPMLDLLLKVKDDRDDAAAPAAKPPKPYFYADSAGTIAAAPAPSVESAPPAAAKWAHAPIPPRRPRRRHPRRQSRKRRSNRASPRHSLTSMPTPPKGRGPGAPTRSAWQGWRPPERKAARRSARPSRSPGSATAARGPPLRTGCRFARYPADKLRSRPCNTK